MQAVDREEFTRQLGELCAGFNVPVGERKDAYWRGLAKMELPTFARVVEHCLGEGGPEKIPTTRGVWALSKSVRPRYTPEPLAKPAWTGDRWDIEANFRLLAHIRGAGKRYAPDSGYSEAAREAIVGALTRAYTAVLVRWKHAFAEDMRHEAHPTPATREAAWRDCIGRADTEIDLLIAKGAAPLAA